MIKITTRKEVVRGEQKRRIIAVEVLRAEELPSEYMQGYPRVYLLKDYIIVKEDCLTTTHLIPNADPIVENDFQKIIGVIRKAGNRLREINKKLAEANKDWYSEETFMI